MRFIDNTLEALWKLLIISGKVVSTLLAFTAKILVGFWDLLCDIDCMRWFTDRMNIVFVEIVNLWNSSLTIILREEIYGFLLNVKNLIETSRRVRVWFFIMLFIVVFFWFYPPYKWGPWYYHESGKASYYGRGFYLNRTSSGERFLPFRHTAAHRTLPIGITVMVVNKDTHANVYVRINDRGPFSNDRIIDLSKSAAGKIGIPENGTANVEIYTRKTYKK